MKGVAMTRRLALVLFLTFAVSGNALAQKVTVQSDEATDFSRFKTFAIRQGTLRALSPVLNSDLMKKRIETEIRKRLVERGLRETAPAADLNVFFMFASRPKGEVTAVPSGPRGLATRHVATEEFEGTLTVDLRDPSK